MLNPGAPGRVMNAELNSKFGMHIQHLLFPCRPAVDYFA
jgi:hypothetical protein